MLTYTYNTPILSLLGDEIMGETSVLEFGGQVYYNN